MSGGGASPAGGPEESDDIDRRFSEIVAHLQHPPRPARTEADSPPSGERPEQESPEQPVGPGQESLKRPVGPGPSGGDESSRADPADDHFIPPQPPPLPAGDLHFWAILAGLTLGPLILLLSTVIPLLDSPVWGVLGVVLSVAGFVLLVLRSPGGDDNWGAQV